ncbi:MAG: ABC transporter ATP-binding protein [Candidatus Zixiibacteriota bacterium]|nr:MAG: ABC transporter ATP-binding protein [candidate division Zixibacteria bacterium]
MSYIQFDNVHKSFNGQSVLSGVDIRIDKGETVVVIGQSGCGKSVLIKHLMRLIEPDRGAVRFDDQDIALLHSRELIRMRRRIGLLFQSAALFDSLTVAENVGLGLRESRQYDREQIREIVMSKLELVGLVSAADKHPSELSGGMRKRVGLARAIATDPEVLLYDEPTTGLDPITADMINELIVQLNMRLHVTSIAVTHDMVSAYKVASRIIMLYDGRVEFDGSPEQVRSASNPIVQQFITGQAQGPIQVR